MGPSLLAASFLCLILLVSLSLPLPRTFLFPFTPFPFSPSCDSPLPPNAPFPPAPLQPRYVPASMNVKAMMSEWCIMNQEWSSREESFRRNLQRSRTIFPTLPLSRLPPSLPPTKWSRPPICFFLANLMGLALSFLSLYHSAYIYIYMHIYSCNMHVCVHQSIHAHTHTYMHT